MPPLLGVDYPPAKYSNTTLRGRHPPESAQFCQLIAFKKASQSCNKLGKPVASSLATFQNPNTLKPATQQDIFLILLQTATGYQFHPPRHMPCTIIVAQLQFHCGQLIEKPKKKRIVILSGFGCHFPAEPGHRFPRPPGPGRDQDPIRAASALRPRRWSRCGPARSSRWWPGTWCRWTGSRVLLCVCFF